MPCSFWSMNMKYVYFCAIVMTFLYHQTYASSMPKSFLTSSRTMHGGSSNPETIREIRKYIMCDSKGCRRSEYDSGPRNKEMIAASRFIRVPSRTNRWPSRIPSDHHPTKIIPSPFDNSNRRRKRSNSEQELSKNVALDNMRGDRDARIDITAQFPEEMPDKNLENRLGDLVQRVLDKLEQEGRGVGTMKTASLETMTSTVRVPTFEESSEGEHGHFEYSDKSILPKMYSAPATKIVRPTLKSAYGCDEWDEKNSVCFFDRNVGDAITFILKVINLNEGRVVHIQWGQEFHVRGTNETRTINITPDNTVWNIVVGSNGQEFRVSPITEIDFDFNRFSATVTMSPGRGMSQNLITRKITFAIRPVPIDLGFVYPGEQLMLNAESFMSLPLKALSYQWFMEVDGEKSTLPSNMIVSPSGACVEISELRKEQEGILVCAVYRINDIFLTKRRFLMKEIVVNALMQERSRRKTRRKTRAVVEDEDYVAKNEAATSADTEDNEFGGVDAGTVSSVSNSNEKFVQDEPDFNNAVRYPIVSDVSAPMNPFNPASNNRISDLGMNSNVPPQQHPVLPLGHTNQMLMPPFPKVNVVEHPNENAEEMISLLLGVCKIEKECSGHASCVASKGKSTTICTCHEGYRGNGIFCWEMIVPGRGPNSVIPQEKTYSRDRTPVSDR